MDYTYCFDSQGFNL